MRITAVAMLFMPPRPPVRLVPGQPCVMGRSPSCDLPIPSAGASRRHAHVDWEQGFVIRDLSSTNGTFVNGEKIDGPRQLEPGDRVMIGDRTITFCRVDPAFGSDLELAAESDTIVFDVPPGRLLEGDALKGSIDEIPTFALLQLLEMGMKTGRLDIRRGDAEHSIWLQSGVPVHAECDDLTGLEAALAILRPLDGHFVFHVEERPIERTLHCSVAELLLEASRRRDEGERAAV